MATALANNVISYCNKRGSIVYACSLDAEGAFDAVPHSILFYKTMDVIPDHCWLVLVNRYKSITVEIKHKCELSNPIKVCKGTRQGGLSSPFLFNLLGLHPLCGGGNLLFLLSPPAGVTVSDYPPVQVTPGGNLKLVSSCPSSFKLPPQFYRLTFNDNINIYFIFFHMALGTFLETL